MRPEICSVRSVGKNDGFWKKISIFAADFNLTGDDYGLSNYTGFGRAQRRNPCAIGGF